MCVPSVPLGIPVGSLPLAALLGYQPLPCPGKREVVTVLKA